MIGGLGDRDPVYFTSDFPNPVDTALGCVSYIQARHTPNRPHLTSHLPCGLLGSTPIISHPDPCNCLLLSLLHKPLWLPWLNDLSRSDRVTVAVLSLRAWSLRDELTVWPTSSFALVTLSLCHLLCLYSMAAVTCHLCYCFLTGPMYGLPPQPPGRVP